MLRRHITQYFEISDFYKQSSKKAQTSIENSCLTKDGDNSERTAFVKKVLRHWHYLWWNLFPAITDTRRKSKLL